MIDFDYWKRGYQHLWGPSGDRETDVAKLVLRLTGIEAVKSGFGTGSTEFIPGQAEKHGYEKGEADLRVIGTNIKLEVTGPLTAAVGPTKPLWVRPDKIANARKHLQERDTWVVHCLERSQMIRVIRLDKTFFGFYDSGKYQTVYPRIRGKIETMVEIPYDDPVVKPFSALIKTIKNAKKKIQKE